MKFGEYIMEYVGGNIEDKVFRRLTDEGFDCQSDPEEVRARILDMNITRFKGNDLDIIVQDFFAQEMNCTRNILQKLFGAKRK